MSICILFFIDSNSTHKNFCRYFFRYCNYQFIADVDSEINEEIECPECHNVIELDWNEDECTQGCSHCKSSCLREEEEEYNNKEDNENSDEEDM